MPIYRGTTISPSGSVNWIENPIRQVWYGTRLVYPTDVGDPPGVPTGLTFNPSASNIFVDWTAPADTATTDLATQYRVEWGEDTMYDDGSSIITEPTTSMTILGLDANETYHIRVRAENLAGQSDWVSGQAYTSTTNVVFSPENIRVLQGIGYLDVSWDGPSEGNSPLKYLLQWGSLPTSSNPYTSQNSPTPLDATSFRINSLSPDTRYTIRIRSERGAAESDWVTVEARTLVANPPQAVRVKEILIDGSTVTEITWMAPIGNEHEHYSINISNNNGVSWYEPGGALLGGGPPQSVRWRFSGSIGTQRFRLRARYPGSVYSDWVIATTETRTPPTNLTLTAAGATLIDVSWDAPTLPPYEYEIGWGDNFPYFNSYQIVRGSTSYQLSGLSPNTEYYIGVRSKNADTFDGASLYVTDRATTYATNPPTNVRVSSEAVTGGYAYGIQWVTPTGNNQNGFELQSSTDGVTWTNVSTAIAATARGFNSTHPTTRVIFRVRARYAVQTYSEWASPFEVST